MPASRGSSQARDRTHVPHVSCFGRRVLYHSWHLGGPREKDFIIDAWIEFSKPALPSGLGRMCIHTLSEINCHKNISGSEALPTVFLLEICEACLRWSPWCLPHSTWPSWCFCCLFHSGQGNVEGSTRGEMVGSQCIYVVLYHFSESHSGLLEAPLSCEITTMMLEHRHKWQSLWGWSCPDRWFLSLLAEAAIVKYRRWMTWTADIECSPFKRLGAQIRVLGALPSQGAGSTSKSGCWEPKSGCWSTSKSGCWEHVQDCGGKTLEACLPVHRNKVTSTQRQ